MRNFLWSRARRPQEVVEATRWVFVVLVLVTLLFALPPVLANAHGTMLLLGLVSVAVLVLSWSAGYLRRSAPLGMDVVDAAAFLGIAAAAPDPMIAIGLIMPTIWFRSLYGSARRAVLRACIYVGVIGASVPLWGSVSGNAATVDPVVLMGIIPPMFLTVIASRQLAGGLRARQQAAQRDAVHMLVGSQLLGVTDAAEIRRIAWAAMAGICAATPGLRVLKVASDDGSLRVEGATGGFAGVPATLPTALLPALVGDGGPGLTNVLTSGELDAAVGTACAWACLPTPREHPQHGSAWLLLGSPRKVPPEAIVAVGTLANQVTLALRNGEVHQALTEQATLDSLTGLANWMSFNLALAVALADESALHTTVLFVDLDDFKYVNDRFGHGAGDDLLREVAARLRRATRPGDLCARLGGDEFAILLRGTDVAVGAEVGQRIVEAIAVTAPVEGGIARVGASVGVATTTGESDLEELIHRADVAMYAAKAKGKNRVQVFEPGLLDGDSDQVVFERQLLAATGNDELVVHYQPVLSLPDGRCSAVEALVRWQHPERGLLYPDAFIEEAERIGAICDIGAYVMRRACADGAAWRHAHPSFPLSIHVNISALQLDDDGFIDSVLRCLAEFAMAPEQLVLEITETVVISSPLAIERLNSLAGHGVAIAIDDFGTGYSALTTLRSLPAKIVKIDKSFVAGSMENPQDRVVIEAVVKMAAQMGMRTIAEGVERLEQRTFLEGIGTDAVQGFLYLRPTTAENFGAWLGPHLAGLPRARTAGEVVVPFTPRHTA